MYKAISSGRKRALQRNGETATNSRVRSLNIKSLFSFEHWELGQRLEYR